MMRIRRSLAPTIPRAPKMSEICIWSGDCRSRNVGRRLAVNATYNLPGTPFWKPVFANWQLGTVLTFQDGTPLNPVYFFSDFANTGTPTAPTLCPGNRSAFPLRSDPWRSISTSTPSLLRRPYTFGNAGRDIIPGPGNAVVDLSLQRRFPIGERIALNVRGEAFNSFNHPNFGIPLPYPDFTGLFGRIFGVGAPRRIQFAMRLEF